MLQIMCWSQIGLSLPFNLSKQDLEMTLQPHSEGSGHGTGALLFTDKYILVYFEHIRVDLGTLKTFNTIK